VPAHEGGDVEILMLFLGGLVKKRRDGLGVLSMLLGFDVRVLNKIGDIIPLRLGGPCRLERLFESNR